MEIQFPSRTATSLSWSAAASHLARVNLTPFCTRSSISSLNCTLLYASSRSTATTRVCFFLLESFVDIVFESGCVFPGGFSCSVPSLVWEKYISLFQVPGRLPGHDSIHQLSRGALHRDDTISVQLAVVLVWFGDWYICDQSS